MNEQIPHIRSATTTRKTYLSMLPSLVSKVPKSTSDLGFIAQKINKHTLQDRAKMKLRSDSNVWPYQYIYHAPIVVTIVYTSTTRHIKHRAIRNPIQPAWVEVVLRVCCMPGLIATPVALAVRCSGSRNFLLMRVNFQCEHEESKRFNQNRLYVVLVVIFFVVFCALRLQTKTSTGKLGRIRR